VSIRLCTVPVAQWLRTGFQQERPEFDITAELPLEVLKITEEKVLSLSLHLQMVNCFYGFLSTINLRPVLTILSNLNSVGC